MASLNKVMLIGNLGRDPEIRYIPSGDAVATLALATTSVWNDKNGQKQEATEWHRVVFFGKQAEICQQYLKKGSSLYVEGKIQTRKWTDASGAERYSTEIRGDLMQMLGGRAASQQGNETQYANASGRDNTQKQTNKTDITNMYDDIPF